MEDICFTILCWFLPYININLYIGHIYICPLLSSPSHLPSHLTSLDCHRAWVWAPRVIQQFLLAILHMVMYFTYGNVILHMVMYLFPCYSLNLSHPLLPLLCPQVCPLCLQIELELVCLKFFPYIVCFKVLFIHHKHLL